MARSNRRPSSRHRVGPAALLTGAAVLLGGCSEAEWNQAKRLAQPEPASDRAEPVLDLWIGSWIAALAVGFVVWGLIIWCVVRYRRRSDDEIPTQTQYHLPIEVLYTITPLIVVSVLFFHTIRTQQEVLGIIDNPDHEITVVGQKWGWTFNYVDEPSLGGRTVYDVGTPDQLAELWLPVGETVTFRLHSADVVHAFWIPQFLFKRDVIPGRTNMFSVTPTREGVFEGRCSEFCGTYHARMLFDTHVVSPEEYDRHLRELQAAGQVGEVRESKYATQVPGLEGQTAP